VRVNAGYSPDPSLQTDMASCTSDPNTAAAHVLTPTESPMRSTSRRYLPTNDSRSTTNAAIPPVSIQTTWNAYPDRSTHDSTKGLAATHACTAIHARQKTSTSLRPGARTVASVDAKALEPYVEPRDSRAVQACTGVTRHTALRAIPTTRAIRTAARRDTAVVAPAAARLTSAAVSAVRNSRGLAS